MYNILKEVSRDPPNGAKPRKKDGEPLLYAFDCALYERDTGKAFIYSIVNLKSGKSEVLNHRFYPMTQAGVEAMLERMRESSVAGPGRLEIDRSINEKIDLQKALQILRAVFTEVLPDYGYAIRKEQISLAEHILTEISGRGVTLAEAEVGTGKTIAYLLPAIIAKRGRLNDFWNSKLYPKMQYADMSKLPIVIATSSIALQRALMTEYIPELSRILLESGVIKKSLTAILRKGKENYICERNLRKQIAFEPNRVTKGELELLLPPSVTVDLAEVDLTPHIKRKISVSGRCLGNCPYRETCEYMKFRGQAQSLEIDIQVCNHNYLLADTLLRAGHKYPVIPNYQTLIVDEAHKFLQAARSMYGLELSSTSAPDAISAVDRMTFMRSSVLSETHRTAKKLSDESDKLFCRLKDSTKSDSEDDESDHHNAEVDADTAKQLRNISVIAERLSHALRDEAVYVKAEELLVWVRKKYGANTSRINLRRVLAVSDASGKSKNDVLFSHMRVLHQTICDLPEIKRITEIESSHQRDKIFGGATEHKALSRFITRDTIWRIIKRSLSGDGATGKNSELIVRLIWNLERVRDQAAALAKHNDLICWFEEDKYENRLCAIPKDLNKRLFTDQWSKGIATVFTSGTLSDAGDFSHIKRTLGIDLLGGRITETSKASPFNHRENTMLYISETVPYPERRNSDYILAVANEVEQLVLASHGHAAVLFTSYKVMDMVWEQIEERKLPFPLFRLDKGGVREIERFKQSDSGVLFASGAIWEGIDIPGDTLSMVIIVKLPFQVPDPISFYEQTLYKDMGEYISKVIVPEMLIKLKQGFGRLIRTESDTGVVAILDCRANSKGAYRARVLKALPECRVTSSVDETKQFYKEKKTPAYFISRVYQSFKSALKKVFPNRKYD